MKDAALAAGDVSVQIREPRVASVRTDAAVPSQQPDSLRSPAFCMTGSGAWRSNERLSPTHESLL